MQALPDSERFARAFAENPTRSNRDKAALAARPLIRSIISRINVPDHPLARPEELFHVGMVAVLQALDQFDPSERTRYSSFAYARIRGEIIDYLRRLDPLPRRRRAQVARAVKLCDQISQEDMADPSDERLAEEMAVDVEQVRQIHVDMKRRVRLSLATPLPSSEDGVLEDILQNEDALEGFHRFENQDVGQYLDRVMRVLTHRQRQVLDLYYREELTQAEIASLLGISEARVSQIRKSVLATLSDRLEPSLRYAA